MFHSGGRFCISKLNLAAMMCQHVVVDGQLHLYLGNSCVEYILPLFPCITKADMQIIKFFLRNTFTTRQKRKSPLGDLNPMPLICQMSALTARPQRISNLSQITYPSDSSLVMSVTIDIIYKMSSAQFYNCASALDGPPSSK